MTTPVDQLDVNHLVDLEAFMDGSIGMHADPAPLKDGGRKPEPPHDLGLSRTCVRVSVIRGHRFR
jgi:hypothetical protein